MLNRFHSSGVKRFPVFFLVSALALLLVAGCGHSKKEARTDAGKYNKEKSTAT